MKLIETETKYPTFGEMTDDQKTGLVVARYVDGLDIEYWDFLNKEWNDCSLPMFSSGDKYRITYQHPTSKNLTIEFTPDELQVLAIIMNNIGGSPSGMRSVSDDMHHMLINAGYEPPLWDAKTGTIILGDFK